MKQKYEEFRKKCYEKYQLNWMLSHGYSLQDLIDAMNEKYMEDDSREYTRPEFSVQMGIRRYGAGRYLLSG